MANAAKRVAELRDLLERANVAYYVDAAPFMADSEYDALLAELAELERAHPELSDAASPTVRVGGKPVEGFESVAHRVDGCAKNQVLEGSVSVGAHHQQHNDADNLHHMIIDHAHF